MPSRNQAVFAVKIDGSDITSKLRPVVQSITVSDQAGRSADTATIVLDDSSSLLTFPRWNVKIEVLLGFRGAGIATVFKGLIDEVRSSGGRDGKTITVNAKGVDTSGKIKEPQKRHFDNLTIKEILQNAGSYCGVTDIRVDQDFASKTISYEEMNNGSFLAFGEQLAKEHGGTFKMRNDIAILAKKNSGRSPSGSSLPPVYATYGVNLHAWDIAPYLGRPRYKQIKVGYYDPRAAKQSETIVDTGLGGSEAADVARYTASSESTAQSLAQSLKADSERNSGAGSVTIEGNAATVAEAICVIAGARSGIDGSYVIDSVEHVYSRETGFVTTLSLGFPSGVSA